MRETPEPLHEDRASVLDAEGGSSEIKFRVGRVFDGQSVRRRIRRPTLVFLAKVSASIDDRNDVVEVVKLGTVELQELKQEGGQIFAFFSATRSSARRCLHLQKREHHDHQRVGTDASTPRFVQVPLLQIVFDHDSERAEHGVALTVIFDDLELEARRAVGKRF